MKRYGFIIEGADGEQVFTEEDVVTRAAYNKLQEALDGLFSNPYINLGDLIYSVREKELKGWEGPAVKQWSDAVAAAEAMTTVKRIPVLEALKG